MYFVNELSVATVFLAINTVLLERFLWNDATFVSTKHFWVGPLKSLPNLPCQCRTAYSLLLLPTLVWSLRSPKVLEQGCLFERANWWAMVWSFLLHQAPYRTRGISSAFQFIADPNFVQRKYVFILLHSSWIKFTKTRIQREILQLECEVTLRKSLRQICRLVGSVFSHLPKKGPNCRESSDASAEMEQCVNICVALCGMSVVH